MATSRSSTCASRTSGLTATSPARAWCRSAAQGRSAGGLAPRRDHLRLRGRHPQPAGRPGGRGERSPQALQPDRRHEELGERRAAARPRLDEVSAAGNPASPRLKRRVAAATFAVGGDDGVHGSALRMEAGSSGSPRPVLLRAEPGHLEAAQEGGSPQRVSEEDLRIRGSSGAARRTPSAPPSSSV